MLCNTENMPIKDWSQLDQGAAMTAPAKLIEKPAQEQQQPLKCPRCDSSNTKFCYYNNYSLSQPRHFCKTCKRYWTKGGTLRNVPVGGGCRKNKRVKRPVQGDPALLPDSSLSPMDLPPIYPLPDHSPPDMSAFILPSFRSKFTSMENLNSPNSSSGFEIPHLSSLLMNFPTSSSLTETGYSSGFIPDPGYNQNAATPSSLLPDFSLLSTSPLPQPHPHKFELGNKETRPTNDYQIFFPMGEKDTSTVKPERETLVCNKPTWQAPPENLFMSSPFDSSLYWNSGGLTAWMDAGNYGSSITPLI